MGAFIMPYSAANPRLYSQEVKMTDTNQEVATATTEEKPERTFTQAEVNTIISERLGKERSKYADYETYKAKAEKYDAAEEASKSELQKATERAEELQKKYDALKQANDLRVIRAKVSQETGVPADLLSGTTEETCTEQAKAILAFAKSNSYPSVKDAGEVRKVTSGKTRDQFKDWFESNIK